LTAAKRLVTECESAKKLPDLFKFAIELDGTPFNGKTVTLLGLENILYRLSRSGYYFDFNKRKFIAFNQDKTMMINWGSLKDGKEYPVTIASIDICGNSELVTKHKPAIMEKVYYAFWEYLNKKLKIYDGRTWSWAGDGGILAFRNEKGPIPAVSCCLEILLSLPVFNSDPSKKIEDDIKIRIGMDSGSVKFYEDTGRIVSDTINYAAHLEKKGTSALGLSVSDAIYPHLPASLQQLFKSSADFEGRKAWSLCYDFSKAFC
jgi:class 3 adenylate cyclase